MSKEDLDFWMDDDSNSNNNEISDEDDDSSQIEAVISPNSKKVKYQKKVSNPKSKKRNRRAPSNTEDDDDDVVITEMPERSNNIPNEFLGELTPFQYQYEPPISKSRESQALEYAVESLKNDINKILHSDDEDDNVVVAPISAPVVKKEGDLTLIFVYPPDDFQDDRILKSGQSFLSVFQTLPQKFQDYNVQIDGLVYDPKEVMNELLSDYTKIVLVFFKKLAVALPNGDKKKVALNPNQTFKDILIKLGIPNGKLMFDGDELPLNQKISENNDLEDGDQIDVCFK